MNEQRFRKAACTGKQNHGDPAHALVACSIVYQQFGHNVFPYKCRFCPNYHLGHTNAKVREFIALLLNFQVIERAPQRRLSFRLGDAMKRAGAVKV